MSFIEGVGDEVTAFFVVLIVIIIATLVTFIGNGSQLYSISPTHTRTVPILAVDRTVEQAPPPPASRTPSNAPLENDRTSESYDSNNIPWSRTENRFYQEVLPVPVEEPSDDSDEQSSSDEAQPSELNPENSEMEMPTAPEEENHAEEINTQSTSSCIRIRLKYLDDTERTVTSIPNIKIGDFKRNHFSEDLANNKIVRLIFCGHLLRDNSTLESYRIVNNSVIHVQVLQAQTNQNRSPINQNADLDLSNLLWPLVSLILGICWIFYFKYPEFFSMLSIGLLFVFTGGFVMFYSHMRQ